MPSNRAEKGCHGGTVNDPIVEGEAEKPQGSLGNLTLIGPVTRKLRPDLRVDVGKGALFPFFILH